MTKFKPAAFLMLLFFSCLLQVGNAQDCAPLTRPQLKDLLVQMGFTVKDVVKTEGKEKYEVSHPGSGFNVPLGYKISVSTNFIWLTAFLGKPETITAEKSMALIKKNTDIQPSFFCNCNRKYNDGSSCRKPGHYKCHIAQAY